MKISTKVVLNEAEIKEAVVEYLGAKLDLPGTPTFTVDFADDTGEDLNAIVDIVSDDAEPKVKDQPKAAPKATGRGKKAAEPVQAETAAVAADKAPWEEPAAVTEEPATESAETEKVEEAVETNVVPIAAAAPKSAGIFPSAQTSAPEPAKPVADPVAAKSLFANLTKPAH